MPLFMFECLICKIIVEKLIRSDDNQEVLCETCGEKCDKQFSLFYNRSEQGAQALYRDKILPDVKKISNDINNGKDDVFFDICGEE